MKNKTLRLVMAALLAAMTCVAAIPENAIQGIVGLILAMLLIPVFRICNLPSFRNE